MSVRFTEVNDEITWFGCDSCEARFTVRADLQMHTSYHHPNDNVYNPRANVVRVRRTRLADDEDRWFPCDRCDSRFKINADLQRHRRYRHNPRPRANLGRTHVADEEIRWFSCSNQFCGFRTRSNTGLARHVCTHNSRDNVYNPRANVVRHPYLGDADITLFRSNMELTIHSLEHLLL
jgi:hypothetical protein